jgi:hypothetical protein
VVNQIEAMKLALEALENWLEFDPDNFGATDNKAVTSLRTAIEEAETPATRPATREEKIVNPGVYEVPVQDRVWPEKFQDRLRDEWYSFDPEVEMSDFSKSVYWLENSPNTRDKLAAKELRRLHEDNIRLKKCLFQMQEAAKQIAAQPAKQWVGLTDEEIEDVWASCEPDWDDKVNVLTLASAIEAKLRKKNLL